MVNFVKKRSIRAIVVGLILTSVCVIVAKPIGIWLFIGILEIIVLVIVGVIGFASRKNDMKAKRIEYIREHADSFRIHNKGVSMDNRKIPDYSLEDLGFKGDE